MDIKARAESHLPTEGPTARTKDSPAAVTQLGCIKARAEMRLQATRGYLTWQRREAWWTSFRPKKGPAFLLAREQEMMKVYMDFAEDQVEVYMSTAGGAGRVAWSPKWARR
jgi:hypothetical protein